MKFVYALVVMWISTTIALCQSDTSSKPPVIDVHLHTPLKPGPVESAEFIKSRDEWIAALDSLNIRVAVLTGTSDFLAAWTKLAPDRFIPALLFPCENGRAPNWGRTCFEDGKAFPSIKWLRAEVQAGRIRALGEVTSQYLGLDPTASELAPFWAMAEESDIPVFLHMGLGPPGAAYESSPVPAKSPNFRAAAGNPLLLEPVLLKHRKLRVCVMHAGWPLADEMIYMLYHHPQVYVDVGVLQYAIPRAEYYHHLQRLVEAGYDSRIMFGSDGGPEAAKRGIEAILKAEFLTDEQKQAMLYSNAARFLGLEPKQKN
ncbi:amidohydrolase family protein [candidate division KSB1 bacterium]|nr:amidohydrolase family protein [candidate division KSB1 bacterium]